MMPQDTAPPSAPAVHVHDRVLRLLGTSSTLFGAILERASEDLGIAFEASVLDGSDAHRIAVTAPGFALLFRNWNTPYFGRTFHVPTRNDLDPKLLTGAAIFGVGWGLGGFCPGPALTALPVAATGTLIFVPFMLAGMWIARHTPDLASKRTEGAA